MRFWKNASPPPFSRVDRTIPSVAACYWVGEAMGSTDFKELDPVPDKVQQTAEMVAGNAAHLAKLLKASPYPGPQSR